MNNNLEIFKNEEFGEIRVIILNKEPMFIGKDLVEKLGYNIESVSYSKYIKSECDEEDYKLLKKSELDLLNITDVGRKGEYLVNESGMYSLVLGSSLPSAKKFKRWITHEVLPTIRKTGGYVNNDDQFINTYLPFADETTKMLFKGTLETVRKQNELIAEQQKEIKYKEDVIIGLTDEIEVAEKRQILNKVVRHKGANYKERWNELYSQFNLKYHIDVQRRLDNYNKEHKPKIKSKVDYIDKVMNKIPELYEIATKLYESDIKELVDQLYSIR